MLIAAIIAAEMLFWVFLFGGLATRYLLGRKRLGMALLLGSPIADAVLLALTAIDLHNGAVATQAHALAAVYLGFTVAFGHDIVRWADVRFAHRFAGGPAPGRRPRVGPERVAREWREFRKAGLAAAVTATILGLLAIIAGDIARAEALLSYFVVLGVVLVIWFLTGPVPALANRMRGTSHVNPAGKDAGTARGAEQVGTVVGVRAGHPGR